jgi:hypothetical protein
MPNWTDDQLRRAYLAELGLAHQRSEWDRVVIIEAQLSRLGPHEPLERMPWEDENGVPDCFAQPPGTAEGYTRSPEEWAAIQPTLAALVNEIARAETRHDANACRAASRAYTLALCPWLRDLPEDHPSRIDLWHQPWVEEGDHGS